MNAADEQADYGSTCDKNKGLVAGGGAASGGGGAGNKQEGEDDCCDLSLSMDGVAMGDMNQVGRSVGRSVGRYLPTKFS